MKNKIFRFLQILLLASATFALISCSGSSSDDDDTPQASSISGTAAMGAPIVGTILVTDSLGATAVADIDASGNYEVDVTGLTPPFIISAIPDDSAVATQYSFASQGNVIVNITPVTTLALFNASGMQDLSALETNWASSRLTVQNIEDAIAVINANFESLYASAGLDTTFDPFNNAFNADGAGFDGLLDSLSITIDASGGTFAVAVAGQPDFSFDLDIDLGDGGSTGASGTWNLSIATTVSGFTTNLDNIVTNLSAEAVPSDANDGGNIEQIFEDQYGALGGISNVNYSITSSSSTKVVAELSATINTPAQTVNGFSIPGQSIPYTVVYTYTKN